MKKLYSIVTAVLLLAVGAISYAATSGGGETVTYAPVNYGTTGYDVTLIDGANNAKSPFSFTDGAKIEITGSTGYKTDAPANVATFKVVANNTVTITPPTDKKITKVVVHACKSGTDKGTATTWTEVYGTVNGTNVTKEDGQITANKTTATDIASMSVSTYEFDGATEVGMKLTGKECRAIFVVTYEGSGDTPDTPTDVSVTWGELASNDMTVGQSVDLPWTAPAGVSVTLSDNSIVAIENGKLVAKAEGTATVTATASVTDATKYNLTGDTYKAYTVTVKAASVDPQPTTGTLIYWDNLNATGSCTIEGSTAPTKSSKGYFIKIGETTYNPILFTKDVVYSITAPYGKKIKSLKFYGYNPNSNTTKTSIYYDFATAPTDKSANFETSNLRPSSQTDKTLVSPVGDAFTIAEGSNVKVIYFKGKSRDPEGVFEVELEDYTEPIKDVTVTWGELTSMTVGQSKDLPWTITPAEGATVEATTSDANVVAIENGKLVAKGEGSATITATPTAAAGYSLADATAKTYTINVTAAAVSDKYVAWGEDDKVTLPQGVTFTGDGMKKATRHTYTFDGVVYTPVSVTSGNVYTLAVPSGKMFKSVKVYAYRSSDDSGNIRYSLTDATAKSNYYTFTTPQKRTNTEGDTFTDATGYTLGEVVPAAGITEIYISPRSSNIDMIIEVELTDYVEPAGPVTVNTIEPTEATTVVVGTTAALPTVVDVPEGVEITYSGNDKNIATVSESGVVTGRKAGTTTVTATIKPLTGYQFADGKASKQVKINITVNEKALGLAWVAGDDNTVQVEQWTFNHAFVTLNEDGSDKTNTNTKQPVINNPEGKKLQFSITFPDGVTEFASINDQGVVSRINPIEKRTGHATVTATVVNEDGTPAESAESVSYILNAIDKDGNILAWGNATSKDTWVPGLEGTVNRLNYGGGTKIEVGRADKPIEGQTGAKFDIDGTLYTAIKVSNGCPTRFKAPEGKIFKKVTIYSTICKNEYDANNKKNANRLTYWKRYNNQMYYVDPAVAATMTVNNVKMTSEAMDGTARQDFKDAVNQYPDITVKPNAPIAITPDNDYSDQLVTTIEGYSVDANNAKASAYSVWNVIDENNLTQYIKEFTINNAGTQVCFVADVEYAEINDLQLKLISASGSQNADTPDTERTEILRKSQLRKAPNFAFPFKFNDYINVGIESDFGDKGYFMTNSINKGSKGQATFNFEHVWDWSSDFPKVQKEIAEVKVHYASTNPYVATVDAEGNVKIHSAGYAYIYAWTDGSLESANIGNQAETVTINGKDYINDRPEASKVKEMNSYGVPTVWSYGDKDTDANAPYKSYTVYYQIGVAPLARPTHSAGTAWDECSEEESCYHVAHQIDSSMGIDLSHAGFGEGKVVAIHWKLEKTTREEADPNGTTTPVETVAAYADEAETGSTIDFSSMKNYSTETPTYSFAEHGQYAKLTAVATLQTADKGEIVSEPYVMYIANDNATGIDEIEADAVLDFNAPMYDLQGRQVNPLLYHGVVLQNGKKFIIR